MGPTPGYDCWVKRLALIRSVHMPLGGPLLQQLSMVVEVFKTLGYLRDMRISQRQNCTIQLSAQEISAQLH